MHFTGSVHPSSFSSAAAGPLPYIVRSNPTRINKGGGEKEET